MPGDNSAVHPNGKGKIFFTEDDHVYRDSRGDYYKSGTRLVHDVFPVFDADAVAAKVATKRGVDAEDLKAEWSATGSEATRMGTRMHENAESQFKGEFDKLHQPENEQERQCFAKIWEHVAAIQSECDYIEPEKIVFSPQYRIAGSIDLLARRRRDGRWIIGDWKRIKALKREAFNDEQGIISPGVTLPNCNYYHYALQLSIYEFILRAEGYIQPFDKVDRWLFIYDLAKQDLKQEPLPPLPHHAALAVLNGMTYPRFKEVPF